MHTKSVKLVFASPKSAKSAAGLLRGQLESVGETKVKAEAKAKTLTLTISTPSAVSTKAATYTARRLGKILTDLDGQHKG